MSIRNCFSLLFLALVVVFSAACGNQEIAAVTATATKEPLAPTDTPESPATPAPSPSSTPTSTPKAATRTFHAILNGLQFDVPADWETAQLVEPDLYIAQPPDTEEAAAFVIAPGGEVSQFLTALEFGVPEDLTPATAEQTLNAFLSDTGGLVVQVDALTGEIESSTTASRNVATTAYEGRFFQQQATITGQITVIKAEGAVVVVITVTDGEPATERAFEHLVTSLTVGEPGRDHRSAVWSADGERLYFTSYAGVGGQVDLYAVEREGGELVQITDDPAVEARVAVSPDGSRLAFTMYTEGTASLTLLDLESGEKEELLDLPQGIGGPAWSPDGSRLAFASAQDENDVELFILSLANGALTQITDSPLWATAPHWSPDGEKIVYYAFPADGPGNADLYVVDADGSNPTRVTTDGEAKYWPQWSPDGTEILYGQHVGNNHWSIFIMDADGTNRRRLTDAPGQDNAPSWSPDGTQIAFNSDRGQEGAMAYNLFVIDREGGDIRQLTP